MTPMSGSASMLATASVMTRNAHLGHLSRRSQGKKASAPLSAPGASLFVAMSSCESATSSATASTQDKEQTDFSLQPAFFCMEFVFTLWLVVGVLDDAQAQCPSKFYP
ncbi:uncharacterized protein [Triticum aestivum]|uniref:uncharacterized protein isoform X3 n=1 Tax=Triticum aestivum TaxID=4565 RepID=UPI001D004AFF|nr:uncharacterized protein LOC123083529 isoform X3 [Triticum aestivum]XP_044389792.1 uncharacterized protein LOC123112769 isoform X3 [Triticum aestivum]